MEAMASTVGNCARIEACHKHILKENFTCRSTLQKILTLKSNANRLEHNINLRISGNSTGLTLLLL